MGSRVTCTAVFDVGKTNKKLLLLAPDASLIEEVLVRIPETTDDEGDACEDLTALTAWMKQEMNRLMADPRWNITHLNFSGYGASFVHMDEAGIPVTPLYDYLKPFPEELMSRFRELNGSPEAIACETASPLLGNLNSGLQLWRLSVTHPELFSRIKTSLHLPQYLSWVFTGEPYCDLTSTGCHTLLWNFVSGEYHAWAVRSGVAGKMAPMVMPGHQVEMIIRGKTLAVGAGLHDSSAALIPYLRAMTRPFLLVSTGTWSITLNPFNRAPLTAEELRHDCLCYLTPDGRQVKAARFFISREHDRMVESITAQFGCEPDFFERLDSHSSDETERAIAAAYRSAMAVLVDRQHQAILLAAGSDFPDDILVDGGFSRNPIFMELMASTLSGKRVFSAILPQASAIGAAMAIGGVEPGAQWRPGLQAWSS